MSNLGRVETLRYLQCPTPVAASSCKIEIVSDIIAGLEYVISTLGFSTLLSSSIKVTVSIYLYLIDGGRRYA